VVGFEPNALGRSFAAVAVLTICRGVAHHSRALLISSSIRRKSPRSWSFTPISSRQPPIDGVVHYCVANMPGAVPRTSTYALNNVTLPYALALADRGPRKALLDNPNFLQGLNVCRGLVTYQAVANDLGCEFVDPAKALAAFANMVRPTARCPAPCGHRRSRSSTRRRHH